MAENPLSDRELQVLQLVATGASNQEVARDLVISVNTVKVHMRKIFDKLEVQSRTEATLRAIQEGWVVVSDDSTENEEAPLSQKTFLLANNKPLILENWKHLYLVMALILAIVTIIVPLRFNNSPSTPINNILLPAPIIKTDAPPLYGGETQVIPASDDVSLWTAQSGMPTGRAGLGLVALDRQIFAIGGVRGNHQATRAVEIYDTTTDRWQEGAAKPTATTDVQAAILGDKIYVPGGCTNDRQAVETVEIYDPSQDIWTQGEPLPAARCGYGLTVFEDKLYLFGGWNGDAFEDTVFVYSAEEEGWETLETTLPEAIGYLGVATLDNSIYLAGGYNGSSEFNQIYQFSPETETWTEKQPMTEKRGGLGLIMADNRLYAVGGGWTQAIETSEVYNPTTDSWTTFEPPITNRWRNLGLAAVEGKMYAVGGWDATESQYLDSVISYQILFQVFIPISVTQ